MGIDAEMTVHSPMLTDDVVVRRLAYELCSAVGPENFWIDRERGHHALALIAPQTVEVNLAGRYYGPGYERGSWPTYAAIMRFFRLRLPDCALRYGGDSDGEIQIFTERDEQDMWQHWAQYQGRPYRVYFDHTEDGIERPTCSLCQEPMVRNGWGAGFGSFFCFCGYGLATRDGGRTWSTDTRL